LHQEKHPEIKQPLNTRQNKKHILRQKRAKMATQAKEDKGLGRGTPAVRYARWVNPPCVLSGSWPCGLDHQHADCNSSQSIGRIEELI
jgi:hypothetical protein